MPESAKRRILIVSNRLPVQLHRRKGRLAVKESPGGLVRALGAVMRRRGGMWIGWPGITGEADLDAVLAETGVDIGYPLRAVSLSKRERDLFYKGFANEVVWPLFHDLHTYCRFDPAYWTAYRRMNERFARAAAESAEPDDYVWIHDYHLMLVGRDLRAAGVEANLGFFLHIPFPAPDVFRKMPWRDDVLDALLHYRLVGLQTEHDLQNLVNTLRVMRPDVMIRRRDEQYEIDDGDNVSRIGAFPIGIDTDEIGDIARSPVVRERVSRLRSRFGDRTFILGVDRLDYTKGLPERLDAFAHMLQVNPGLRGQVTLLQHVAPSREDVGRYPELRREVEGRVGSINGRFGTLDWTPVQYMYNYLGYEELVSLYRLAQVAIVTSLKDGQNLVCKEFCAAHPEGDAALVLSEFAGAAEQLHDGALLINPHDVEGTAEAIRRAVLMPQAERRERMQTLHATVDAHDVFWWVDAFLRDLGRHEPPRAAEPTALEPLPVR